VTVRAERERDDGADYVRRERRRHDVDRRVTLPAAVEETDASATLDDGVLAVSLPKRGGDEGTKIDVE
jgi:HSP20 family molecular chaperone IbpA